MSRRTILTAILGGLAFAAVGVASDADPLALTRLTLLGLALGAIVLTDLAERRIPNRIVLPATAAGAGLSLAGGAGPHTLTALLIVAILLALALLRPAALGMGDVKLALLLALTLGAAAATALVLGFALAAAAGLALLARHGRAAGQRALPLAPFLATGALLALHP